MTLAAPHLTKSDAPAAMRNDQSNREPKTSNAGSVVNKFVVGVSAPSSGDGGGGGKEERICTRVERR